MQGFLNAFAYGFSNGVREAIRDEVTTVRAVCHWVLQLV
jgi:hypothetical protein